MKLKSFKIQNYRSCLKTELKLNNNLTGLIGINGSGKSNILNAILLLRKINQNRFGPNKNEPSNNKSNINIELEHEGKILFIKGIIVIDTDEHNVDYIQSCYLEWNLKNYISYSKWFLLDLFLDSDYRHFVNSQKLFINREINSKFSIFDEMDKLDTDKIIAINNMVNKFFNGINYYSASVFSDPTKCPSSIEFEDNRPSRRFRGTYGHDKFIIDLFNSFKQNDIEYKRYINTVNKSGIGLIDDVSFTEVPLPSTTYDVKSVNKINMEEKNRLLVVPNFTIDGINLSPNQLSEGTFKTLALIFYILTDNSELLLIEEPEVCVHHGLLTSIIELIKSQSKQKQIIISTHSDFVLDHLDPDNIVLVKRQVNKGTIANQLNKSMSKNDFKALRSYLDETGNLGEYWKEGGFDNE